MEKKTRHSHIRDAKPRGIRHKRWQDKRVISILTIRLSASLRQITAEESMNCPTLQTKDLVLKPLKEPIPIQPVWLNEPKNVQFSEQRWIKHSMASCAKYVKECTYFWGIELPGPKKWVGTIAVHVDEPNRVAEIGILVDHTFGGNGYGTQAWLEVQNWVLGTGVRKIEAGCMKTNEPMLKIFKKAGMTFEAEKKGHFLKDGAPISAVYYARWK